jgi:threonine/homoserine/homoserine lactone efflux protein
MPRTMLYISVETFGAFALTSLVIELPPGPNMAILRY